MAGLALLPLSFGRLASLFRGPGGFGLSSSRFLQSLLLPPAFLCLSPASLFFLAPSRVFFAPFELAFELPTRLDDCRQSRFELRAERDCAGQIGRTPRARVRERDRYSLLRLPPGIFLALPSARLRR